MNAPRIAVVTGASQGLGRALVQGLVARMQPEDLVLLTGPNEQRAADAAAEIAQAPGTRSRVEAGAWTSPTPMPSPLWPTISAVAMAMWMS
jgi:NAD(P)-dependent dehydrogenase (short-subunit alcohol dehydrogenase family)